MPVYAMELFTQSEATAIILITHALLRIQVSLQIGQGCSHVQITPRPRSLQLSTFDMRSDCEDIRRLLMPHDLE